MFSEQEKKENDKICHKMVITKFLFAKKLATELSGGEENVELEKVILEKKTIERLEELFLKKIRMYVPLV